LRKDATPQWGAAALNPQESLSPGLCGDLYANDVLDFVLDLADVGERRYLRPV
jgi:hypothetical protein